MNIGLLVCIRNVFQGVAVGTEYGRATQLLKYTYRMTLDSKR